MKRLLLLTALFAATAFTKPTTDTISVSERKFAVDNFQHTKERFLKDVKGLSAAQLSFKADTSRWSIAQCIEHIALAENLIWQWEQGMMKQPAAPEKRSQVKITNEQLMVSLLDRSNKVKAPEVLKPSGKFANSDAAIHAFTLRRDSTIQYLKTTQDDLKNHFGEHPVFGTLDTYQLMLLLSGHSERHTLQIEEVMATPGFPKQ
jgi:DinB superfamily